MHLHARDVLAFAVQLVSSLMRALKSTAASQWPAHRVAPVIFAYSRFLLPKPADWGSGCYVTGPFVPLAEDAALIGM